MTSLAAPAVAGWTAALAGADLGTLDDTGRIDLIRALEELKCAAEGVQARVTADFHESQCDEAAAAGIPESRRSRGIAEQVALARRESPHRGRLHVGLAQRLATDLPCTAAALTAGRITEYRASLIARETSCLSHEDRLIVDATVAGDPERVAAMGDRRTAGEVRKLAAELDVEAVCERRRQAESERRVTIRPAPDQMAWVTALLPVQQGVALYAALRTAATAANAAGDPRPLGQFMADTLVESVLGGSGVAPVALQLVMTDRSLFLGEETPATLGDHGPVPAELARRLVAEQVDARSRVWLRRLYTHPGTGELVEMDSRQRRFPLGLRRLIQLRDQTCRTPWCDAPLRQSDHAEPHHGGGPTSLPNGQGLCQSCNLAKEAPGWRAGPVPGLGHQVETTTPTGHSYRSRAPAYVRPTYVPTRPGVWTLIS